MGARPQGRSAVHPSAPKLRPQHRKSHLKASLGGSYGGAGGVLGHPFNCLSTGTPASCASPASGHRHSGCLGSGRSEFTPYLCCFSARCSGQVLEPASAKEWCLLAPGVGVGWLRGLLGTGGGTRGNGAACLTSCLARSLPELGAQGSGVLPVLWEGRVEPQNRPHFLRIV